MIAKGVVQVLGVDVAEFPKVAKGERPWHELTYWDRESRDKPAVTVLIAREVPPEAYPSEGDRVTLELQVEQVARVVKRQDRDDPGRTYDSAAKQFKVQVIGFEGGVAKPVVGKDKAAA